MSECLFDMMFSTMPIFVASTRARGARVNWNDRTISKACNRLKEDARITARPMPTRAPNRPFFLITIEITIVPSKGFHLSELCQKLDALLEQPIRASTTEVCSTSVLVNQSIVRHSMAR